MSAYEPDRNDLTLWREANDDVDSGYIWHWRQGNGFGRCPDGLTCLLTNHPGFRARLAPAERPAGPTMKGGK